MGYTKKALNGIGWVGAFRGITRIFAIVRAGILARILSPAQFGVYGIAALVLTFLETITETGINVVLIQEKEDIKGFIDTAWIVSILRGFLVTLLIFISAPFIANFFKTPEALQIIRLIGFVAFLRGFINPAFVKLQKDLEFGREFRYKTAIFVVDASVAIFVALLTNSPNSIVWGLIAGAFAEVVISFLFISPRPKFAFEKIKFKSIVSRGKWVTLNGVFNYATDEGDDIVVGRLLDTTALGLYQAAFKISSLPITEIVNVVTPVTFPVFTKISEEGDRLRKAFLKVFVSTLLIILPLSLVIFVFAEPITRIILGPNWLGVIPILRVLAIYGAIKAILLLPKPLFLALERQKWVTQLQIVQFTTLAVTIIPMINAYGVIGAAYSTVLSVLIPLPLEAIFLRKLFLRTKNGN